MNRPEDIPAEIWEQADILKDELREYKDDLEYTARLIMWLKQPEQPGMTHEQAKCLTFVRGYQAQNNGVSPSYAEIAEAVGRTKSNVHDLLHRMADRGVIRLAAARARSITILVRA